MNRKQLIEAIQQKKSYLCVGLDTDISLIPTHLHREQRPALTFNKAIIDATKDYAVSYKINTAFYESQGPEGWRILDETLKYIPTNIFTIADAKRGDIGNTANHYARTFFISYPFHSVTLSPYMGLDTLQPFLDYGDKWLIVLGLTSNPGAQDFEMLEVNGEKLYLQVMKKVADWASPENLMFVVGATRPDQLKELRTLFPDFFFLVPGVGAQGGDLKEISKAGLTKDCGLLVNASRSIIYASKGADFAEAANKAAQEIQTQMADLLYSFKEQ